MRPQCQLNRWLFLRTSKQLLTRFWAALHYQQKFGLTPSITSTRLRTASSRLTLFYKSGLKMTGNVKKFWLTIIATVTASCILGGMAWLDSVYVKIISLDRSASETVMILRQIQKDNEKLVSDVDELGDDVKVNTSLVAIHGERIGDNRRTLMDHQRILELLRK